MRVQLICRMWVRYFYHMIRNWRAGYAAELSCDVELSTNLWKQLHGNCNVSISKHWSYKTNQLGFQERAEHANKSHIAVAAIACACVHVCRCSKTRKEKKKWEGRESSAVDTGRPVEEEEEEEVVCVQRVLDQPHRHSSLFILSWPYRILSRFVGNYITERRCCQITDWWCSNYY